MDKIVMRLEIDRLTLRINGIKEWRDQLNERISNLEQKRQSLMEAVEDES